MRSRIWGLWRLVYRVRAALPGLRGDDDEKSASLGNVIRKIYHTLKANTAAERVYQVTLVDGVPHFHTWLIPHRKDEPEKGMRFLSRDDSCREEDAFELANKLRGAMKS